MAKSLGLWFAIAFFQAAYWPMAAFSDPLPKYLQERPVKRLALLLGNWEYPSTPLKGIDQDQAKLGSQLKALGFDVTSFSNFRNQEELVNDALNPFLQRIGFGDFVIIYYSGHGLSFGNENFPVPTKLPGEIGSRDFFNHFVSVEEFHRKVVSRHAGISMVILDACRTYDGLKIRRDDGTPEKQTKGLSKPSLRLSTNMVLAYAAEPGDVALAESTNSIFTEALVHQLSSGVDEYDQLKRGVINQVLARSADRQQPWFSDSATAVIRFRETQETRRMEREAWLNSLQRGSAEAVRTYMRTFPSSFYIHAAREWLRDHPQAPAITTTSIPAVLVAEAWTKAGSSNVSVPRISAFRFPQAGVASSRTTAAAARLNDYYYAGPVARVNSQVINDTVLTSGVLVANKPIAVRAAPDGSSRVVATAQKEAVFTMQDTVTDKTGKDWIRARTASIDNDIYIETPPAASIGWNVVSLGNPGKSGFVSVNPASAGTLVREIDVYKLVASVGDGASSISWALIEAGRPPCSDDTAACQSARDRKTLQTFHAEALLVGAGIPRSRISIVANGDGIPVDALRLKLFTGEKNVK